MVVETSNKDSGFRLFETHDLVEDHVHELMLGMVADTRVKETPPVFREHLDYPVHTHSSQAAISQETSNVGLSDQSKDGWIAYIQQEFYSIPKLEAIHVTIHERDVDIWLVIPNRDFTVVSQIAQTEVKVLKEFASPDEPLFMLDFHVIYRCGADETQFVPQEAIRLSR